jgi:hypothetical protein
MSPLRAVQFAHRVSTSRKTVLTGPFEQQGRGVAASRASVEHIGPFLFSDSTLLAWLPFRQLWQFYTGLYPAKCLLEHATFWVQPLIIGL